MMEEINRRLDQIESSVGQCAKSMNECSKNIELMQRDMKYQNETSEKRMCQFEKLLETQHLVLHGNPRQDTKDRGLIGDLELLKDSAARKKKYYWMTIPVVITVLASSFWNAIFGKDDHGRPEPTETKANKTSPDPGDVWRHDRSRRE